MLWRKLLDTLPETVVLRCFFAVPPDEKCCGGSCSTRSGSSCIDGKESVSGHGFFPAARARRAQVRHPSRRMAKCGKEVRFFPNSACRGKMRGPKVCAETKKDYLCTTKCITHLFYKPDQPKATTEYREICRCFFMSKSFFRGRDCFLWRDPFRGHFFATQPFFGCIVFCAAALLRVLCFLCRDPFRRRGQNGYPTPKLRAVFFQRRLCIHLSPAGWLGLWICMPQSRRRMTNLMSRRRPNPVLNPSCL